MDEKKAAQRIARLGMARLELPDYMAVAVALGVVDKRALDPKTQLSRDLYKAARVKNWVNGNNAPKFTDTMTLLSEAGLLQPEAEAAWRGISLSEATRDVSTRRTAIARRVAAEGSGGRKSPAQEKRKTA